jgi:hypothetical protein
MTPLVRPIDAEHDVEPTLQVLWRTVLIIGEKETAIPWHGNVNNLACTRTHSFVQGHFESGQTLDGQ